MAASNGFPNLTTAGQGLFNGASSVGMIQGQADPDPATRFALRAGMVSQSETVPMWGGQGIYALVSPISASGPRQPLGLVVGRATQIAAGNTSLVGFSVFDQGYNMVNDPTSPVPTSGSGQSLNWYPLGSRARIAVACDASLISFRNGILNPQVSWDFVNDRLIPYSPAYAQGTITGATWANTAGGQIDFTVTTDYTASINAGDDINVANVVNTGGASTSAFNGPWIVVSVTSTHIVVSAPASATLGTYASGGNVLAGGGALPVTLLDVQPTGNMTVTYNPVTGAASYNYNGACAKIQLTGGTTA